jgi:hypothetical protein
VRKYYVCRDVVTHEQDAEPFAGHPRAAERTRSSFVAGGGHASRKHELHYGATVTSNPDVCTAPATRTWTQT